MARVLVTRRVPGEALERLKAVHEVEVWAERMPPSAEQLRTLAADKHGLLTLLTDRVDAALLEAAPELRAVANFAVGYDNIDLEATAARGIAVGNTPDVLTDATADLTFALLLAAARRLPQAIDQARTEDWLTWEPGEHLGASVYGATLGIVGYGRIGRAVAERARGFGMTVLHTGRPSGTPLPGLLEASDFVSLHVPLTEETRRLIDESALASMQSTAILINTARGPIVDQPALLRALADGKIAAAAIDVTDPEPPSPDDPVLRTPNLLVTPHIGSATRAARERMTELAGENLLAALAGRPMPYPVPGTGPMNIAVVDIGSNSTRLLVAEVRDERVTRELERESNVTRLGTGVDASGKLQEDAMERVYGVLDSYRELIDRHGVDRSPAVLTSAVRDAANGEEFAGTVRERFGLEPHVLSGDQEAQLTFLGATGERDPDDATPTLVIDIGGGSTELVIGTGHRAGFHVSTQAGVVRQSERHIDSDPPEADELRALRRDVDEILAAAVPKDERTAVQAGIAVAGTATSLGAIAQRLDPYDPDRVQGYRLTATDRDEIRDRLIAMTVDERRRLPGLHPDRAPTIIPGVVIMEAVMELFGLKEVEISEHDILRGAAIGLA